MSKFESSVKQIPYAQTSVYEKLSDLSNIEKVKDRLPEDKAKDLEFTQDSISVSVAPVGRIQLLPTSEASSKMKLTLKADINPFIKGMISGPLQDGLEKIADMLAMINYE